MNALLFDILVRIISIIAILGIIVIFYKIAQRKTKSL